MLAYLFVNWRALFGMHLLLEKDLQKLLSVLNRSEIKIIALKRVF